MKMKIGFGEGGFQGFMARHVEKCVLSAVIALMAYFIYSGSSAKSLQSNITRDKLSNSATEAEGRINRSSFTAVAKERDPGTNVAEVVKSQSAKVDSRVYACRVWDNPLVPRLTPRMDPRLLPAEKLEVVMLEGPLAMFPAESADAELPEDPLLRFPVTVSPSGAGGYGGYGAAGMDSTDMPETGTKPKSRRDREKEREKKAAESPASPRRTRPGQTSPPSPPPGSTTKGKGKKGADDPYAGVPGSTSTYGNAKKVRTIPPEATLGLRSTPDNVIRPSYAAVVKAVVPYAKQWDEFQRAFKDAPGGQDPSRDIPVYLSMIVQRREVADEAPANPDDGWKSLSLKDLKKLEGEYGVEVPELIDPDSLEETITRPVPPFLLTDLRPALLHSETPRATLTDPTLEEEAEEEMVEGSDGVEIFGAEEGKTGMPKTARPRGGPGMGDMPGGARPRTARPPRSGGSAMPSMGGPGRRTPGVASSPMGGSINLDTYRPVKQKLVRFVDFNVEPGKKYQYRIQLVLADPNHPREPSDAPDVTTLDDKARERVKAIDAKDAKAGSNARTYWVTTPYSEPSEPVSLPRADRFLASESVPASTATIAGAAVSTHEPHSKVLSVKWDDSLGIYAPAEQNVYRASVLNSVSDVEFLHPIRGDLRKIEKYALRTDGIVLDMLGGDVLPGGTDSKERQRAPGETLIMDAEGNLIVADESHDVEGYHQFVFPEPKEEPKPESESESTSPTSGYPGTSGSKTGRPPKSPSGPSSPTRSPRGG
jgi:hypothetical protein